MAQCVNNKDITEYLGRPVAVYKSERTKQDCEYQDGGLCSLILASLGGQVLDGDDKWATKGGESPTCLSPGFEGQLIAMYLRGGLNGLWL